MLVFMSNLQVETSSNHLTSVCMMEALLTSNVQHVSTLRNVIQDFVELHIFAGAQNVVHHLRNHDCSAALQWCEDNRARVKRHRNRLEFKLRLQVSYVSFCLALWAPCTTVVCHQPDTT